LEEKYSTHRQTCGSLISELNGFHTVIPRCSPALALLSGTDLARGNERCWEIGMGVAYRVQFEQVLLGTGSPGIRQTARPYTATASTVVRAHRYLADDAGLPGVAGGGEGSGALGESKDRITDFRLYGKTPVGCRRRPSPDDVERIG
jgi:hypothetical protein